MTVRDVRDLLVDPGRTGPERLLRLQGLRCDALVQGVRAGWATRIGPAVCGAGTAAALAFDRVDLLAVNGALAAIGVLAPNHPFEMLYNALAPRVQRTRLPANHAPRRLGCALGAAFLAGAAAALALGARGLGVALAISMIVVPGFVASTNLCLPSMLFTVVFGAEAGTRRSLWRRGTHSTDDTSAPVARADRVASATLDAERPTTGPRDV